MDVVLMIRTVIFQNNPKRSSKVKSTDPKSAHLVFFLT
jgi:hypothetical protein